MTMAPPVFGASASGQTSAVVGTGFGPTFYVDTIHGSANANARSPKNAASTFARVFVIMDAMEANEAHSADNATIYWQGVVAEQITTPLSGESGVGVSGVTVVAAVGGNNRHDDGARWKQAATAGDAPLLTVRGQGWTFLGGLFVPQATYSCIRLRRQEDATYPDGSHAIIQGVRFIGNEATPAGIGLEDYGGNSHIRVIGCEFSGLVAGYTVTNQSIDLPNHNYFADNVFFANTEHFKGAQKYGVIIRNRFLTVTTSTNAVLNTIYGQADTTAASNQVALNTFPDLGTDIKNDDGYVGSTTDTWSNYSTGTAALIVESPPGAS